MSAIPVVVNFQGDFVLQLVTVETQFTMDQVAEAAAFHSLNRRVKPQPDKTLRVRLQDAGAPFDRTMTVTAAELQPMDTLEVFYE